MRKTFGLFMAVAVAAATALPAYAGCHGGSARAYQEYQRFLGLVPQKIVDDSADIVAAVDDFFATKYPKGQLPVDPSKLSDAEVAIQQRQVIRDYQWLQAQLVTLRERAKAAGAPADAVQWLAYVELPIVYGPELGKKILTEDLPKLANFSTTEAYPQAKFDAVVQACATSLEVNGFAGQFDIGSRAFFVKCGELQPSDKQTEGHMQLTHTIYDSVEAMKAYQLDHGGLKL